MDNAMSIISSLKPKYYQFRDDGKYASLHLPTGTHYGLLAQDMEEVLPNLVKDTKHEIRDLNTIAKKLDANGKPVLPIRKNETKESINIKAVNYTELTAILIKAMQEQEQTNQDQKQLIQQLQQENKAFKDRFAKLEAAIGSGMNNYKGELNGVDLQQNYPNPFSGTTMFNYSIPKGASGKILVYDASGKLVRTLAASDAGQVQMNANGLKQGTYVYTLLVNGEIAGSKQMVLTK